MILRSRNLRAEISVITSRLFGKKARSLGLEQEIHLYPNEIGTILVLSQDYAEKNFEYAEAEQYTLPFIHLTKRTADRLVLLLNPDRKVSPTRAHGR